MFFLTKTGMWKAPKDLVTFKAALWVDPEEVMSFDQKNVFWMAQLDWNTHGFLVPNW